MNPLRVWKSLWYPCFPSWSAPAHEKRRKGLFYRFCPPDGLECQQEQDRMFWKKFLRPERGGEFCELGGNGLIGSHTLGLERQHGWTGCLVEPAARPRRQAQQSRSCRTLDSLRDWGGENRLDLLAVHRPQRFPEIWERLRSGRLRPGWVVVENLEPDPQWSRLLERSGYRLRFFFHDDEYFQLTSR